MHQRVKRLARKTPPLKIKKQHYSRLEQRDIRTRKFHGPDFSLHTAAHLDFPAIFGTSSLESTIAVLIRLCRMKRIAKTGTAKKLWPIVATLDRTQDILPNRRFHHLTPLARDDMPYAGDSPQNLLLIKKSRHAALHLCFGGRTLEEIIILLLRLRGAIYRKLCQELREWYLHAMRAASPEAPLLHFQASLPRLRFYNY